MKIPPYLDVEWQRGIAAQAGKCALSGSPIRSGDAIFVNDHPRFCDLRVLISAVTRYKIALQVQAWSADASRHHNRASV